MSKLFENKQMIHIASEVVVLVGLTYYFSQKNRKLMSQIEDLHQKIEEQDENINKNYQLILQLSNTINKIPSQVYNPTTIPLKTSLSPEQVNLSRETPSHFIHISSTVKNKKEKAKEKSSPKIEELIEIESTDLDTELMEELEDLKE